MADRSQQQPHQHSPGARTLADCRLCAIYRHPGQAAQGRALTKHLAAHPLPRQAVASA